MKLSRVDCSRGAPMGRPGNVTESAYPVKFHLAYVPFVDYCYDQGGAYWGMPANLYRAWGDGAEEQQELFLRAPDRQAAKVAVLAKFPAAKFYR